MGAARTQSDRPAERADTIGLRAGGGESEDLALLRERFYGFVALNADGMEHNPLAGLRVATMAAQGVSMAEQLAESGTTDVVSALQLPFLMAAATEPGLLEPRHVTSMLKVQKIGRAHV